MGISSLINTTLGAAGNIVANALGQTTGLSTTNSNLEWPFAANLFNVTSVSDYLIPKPKFLYYVKFILSPAYQLNPTDHQRLGYLVKSVERPKFQYRSQEVDQYNRKRIFHTKIDYSPISFTFYDVVDSTITKLIDDYNRYNFGDFGNLYPSDSSISYDVYWKNNTIRGNDMNYWGLRLKNPKNYMCGPVGKGLPTAENFFSEIRIYEFYGNNFTQYSLMNPKIENIVQDSFDSSVSEFMEVTISVNPEGVVYNYIDAPIDSSVIAQTILPGPGFSTNNFPIAEMNVMEFLAGSIARAGGGLLGQMTNGIFGNFGSLNSSTINGIGILGGAALQMAGTGYLGPGLSSVASTANAAFATSYTSVTGIPLKTVVTNNALCNLATITGGGSSAINIGQRTSASSVSRVLSNISALI
jgi:hypothetical protein